MLCSVTSPCIHLTFVMFPRVQGIVACQSCLLNMYCCSLFVPVNELLHIAIVLPSLIPVRRNDFATMKAHVLDRPLTHNSLGV